MATGGFGRTAMRVAALAAGLGAMVMGSGTARAVEEPAYTVVIADGPFEVRDYGAMIAAEVTVTAERREAANRGFRPLANYIFGDNAPNAKIAMTAPVTEARAGQKIAMTAPVTEAPSADGVHVVRFIMPSAYTLETLPAPNDPNVTLTEIPARRVAAVRFAGFAGADTQDRKEAELRTFLAEKSIEPVGDPVYAYYDAPWTPPFLRRNEVMLEVRVAE